MKETVPAYRRHDISDETWALLEPHLPGRRDAGTPGRRDAGTPGRVGRDSRRQPIIYQCGVLDFARGGVVAGSATGLWRMEEYARYCPKKVFRWLRAYSGHLVRQDGGGSAIPYATV